MQTKQVNQNGQVTLPVKLRSLLGIEINDEVTLQVADGGILVKPAKTRRERIEEAFGGLTPTMSAEEYEELLEANRSDV